MNPIKTFAAAALVAAATLCAAPCFAEDPNLISVRVSTDGLDLSSQAGAKVMVARLRQAAQTVCGIAPDFKQIDMRGIYDNCVAQTTDRAVATLDSSMVTAANTHPGHRPIVLSALSH